MELLHGLSPEQSAEAKIFRLQSSRDEVLVLTSPRLCTLWAPALREAMQACAARGLTVRVLLEPGTSAPASAARLRAHGIEARAAPLSFARFFSLLTLQSEAWIFDRAGAITANERVVRASGEGKTLRAELALGAEAASGLAGYFENRWESQGRTLAFSVRHKTYALHGGTRTDLAFFASLADADHEILLSVPGGRVSRRVEVALHQALQRGVRVILFTNADRDDTPGLRRLRRLTVAGAAVKICGHRLRSELALLDGKAVYLGSLPSTWSPWRKNHGPSFVFASGPAVEGLRAALEAQVSIEVASSRA